jgi:hypothetical protein
MKLKTLDTYPHNFELWPASKFIVMKRLINPSKEEILCDQGRRNKGRLA